MPNMTYDRGREMTAAETERAHYDQARAIAEELAETVERIRRLRQLANRGQAPDEIAEPLEEQLREEPLAVDKIVTYRVTLGTGGPANGVDFRQDGTAAVWWQDWFTPKTFYELDSDVANELAGIWWVGDPETGEEWAR
jgi:hypothetical protein